MGKVINTTYLRTGFNYAALLATVAGTLFLGACAKEVKKSANQPTTPTETDSDRPMTYDLRSCPTTQTINFGTNVVTEIESKLSAFFAGTAILTLEGQPTWCMRLSQGSGSEVSGTFRLEYEDDTGIRSFTIGDLPIPGANDSFRGGTTFFGSFSNASGTLALELIFTDDYGFVGVKGSKNATTGKIDATIRYYNFPTFAEVLKQQIDDIKLKCQTGQLKPAQCLGYGPPTFSWYSAYSSWFYNIPGYQEAEMVQAAKDILADNTKSKQLGTISIESSNLFK